MVRDTTTSESVLSVRQRVEQVLERIRPTIQSDGGDLELVDVTDEGVVKIRLLGDCVKCPSSDITLKVGIEQNVRQFVPEIVAIEQVP